MNWFIRWVIGAQSPFRKTEACDEDDLALVRELADMLEARELAAETQPGGENLAC